MTEMDHSIKYPIGIQDFAKLREYGFEYVDKTGYIKRLLRKPAYYFLSRPRRFGKSLFLSTLKAYFEGRKELFKGLALDSDDTDWTLYPVVYFSLNTIDPKADHSLYELFDSALSGFESRYGSDGKFTELSIRFENLILNIYKSTGKKVVILIDEYDAPLLSTLDKPELNVSYRETLKSIFSVMKSSDAYIHFAFITGVSRFSHTSLFSGANNLKDISLSDEYSAICGITEKELVSTLNPGIRLFADGEGISEDQMLSVLKENYDGYHFSKQCPDIYNPFSLLSALDGREIKDYWFQSGTPSYLIEVLKKDDFYLPDLDCLETFESELSVKESYLSNPISLLFESGYLTIKAYEPELQAFTLGLPNKEVGVSLSKALMPIYSGLSERELGNLMLRLRKAVVNGNAEEMMYLLKVFLAGNPYSNTELAKREKYFKNNLYLALKSLGFQVETEKETCNARMDLFLITRRYIYIFELKTDHSAELAVDQIEDRNYAFPLAGEYKKIIKIGANYSSALNNIDSWIIK